MTIRHTPTLRIGDSGGDGGMPALSAAQKKFNSLVKRIESQRALLAAWQEAVPAYRARHARELEPLLGIWRTLRAEQLRLLDAGSGAKGLSKADRAALHDLIADIAADLIDATGDDAERQALKEIHDRHADEGFDAARAGAREAVKAVARDAFGLDLGDDVDLDSPEDVLRRVEAQMHAARDRAEEQRAAHHAARGGRGGNKPGARERREQEAAQQAGRSVREVYRKLASALHPDREGDPAERERKTALMQRANDAYAAGRLLDLLQLQLEAEQIDPQHIARLGEERLRHYNRVLAEQLAELQRETLGAHGAFCMEFGYDAFAPLKPARLPALLRAQVRDLQDDIGQLRVELQALREHPAYLKRWLRQEVALRRRAGADGLPFDEDFLDELLRGR
ncbi:molecular chaperone DnaJ [Xylophilus sp.]|uniref:molecular chaperone DnaJ n=1 Tax=Xylophilus sp. TaxID=2653893 RepID=UPI0013BD659A|nr:molecular chaperone DnaJ [Xylophilus sp.]KAF1049568.1 MAG: hypothetical protein GAK38_00667 [Xylophilus sp.]